MQIKAERNKTKTKKEANLRSRGNSKCILIIRFSLGCYGRQRTNHACGNLWVLRRHLRAKKSRAFFLFAMGENSFCATCFS